MRYDVRCSMLPVQGTLYPQDIHLLDVEGKVAKGAIRDTKIGKTGNMRPGMNKSGSGRQWGVLPDKYDNGGVKRKSTGGTQGDNTSSAGFVQPAVGSKANPGTTGKK